MSKTKPDPITAERIGHLAIVGKALLQRASDSNFETNFLLAKDSLNKFKEMIDDLDLKPETLEGMHNLVEYLQVKIEKRLVSNVNMTPLK